jgi:hypothetical protein
MANQAQRPVEKPTIRESYLRFPSWSQPLWTYITGKPLNNEKPIFSMAAPIGIVGSTVVFALCCWMFLESLTSTSPAVKNIAYIIGPIYALYVTGFLRKMQVVYGHHAIHNTVFRQNRNLNKIVAKNIHDNPIVTK